MDFFDFDFDLGDWLRAVLAAVLLLGSVQLHAVVSDHVLHANDAPAAPVSE
jgi:hypothetical protein